MQINLNLWVRNPAYQCDDMRQCAEAIRPALTMLGVENLDQQNEGILPSGVRVKVYTINLNNTSPLALAARKALDIGGTTLTFAFDRTAGQEVTVAKLVGGQITAHNIARMMQSILKLQWHPDGNALFNPDWGLITIGKTTDAPGGSLIGINIFGNETNLDFDKKMYTRLLSALILAGIVYAGSRAEKNFK